MGLKDILTTTGSPYSVANGGPIATNPLSTKLSTLHADPNGLPGYSLDGLNAQEVNAQAAQYNDGIAGSQLPPPSLLDNTLTNTPMNPNHQYINNLPT